ncbi:MAG TPA: ATP-binding protein [Pyrinomonadaceae bacterium]|nr:ATP-binding protein [Pyrinomonadaceae bacterium]
MRQIKSAPLRYGLALASFALILLVSFGLPRVTSLRIDLTALIILVMIASAWYLGRGPGLMVALLFELTLDLFATAPVTLRSSFIIFNRLVLFGSVVLFASSRRNAEKRLRQQREWLEVTLSSIGDAVIATDLNGIVIFLNPTAETLTGWSGSDAVNRPLEQVFNIINEQTREPVESMFASVKRRGAMVGLANHSTLIAKDGTELPIEDSGAPIRDAEGNVIGVIIVFHDVSERRRAEREREDLLAREQTARAQAEAASRLKDEFLATVSHELRTPLSAILGWSAMLNVGTVKKEDVSRALEIIERNARAQARIVTDILEVSRIITGQLKIKARPLDLSSIVQAAVESLKLAADAKEISLTTSLNPATGSVVGDPDRLQQVVWNLIGNAIKFTPREGRVAIEMKPVDSHVELRVTDTGIGISEEFLPYVFDRFRQADSTTTRMHGGLGLGLSIVRHLVELHGGTVSVSSCVPGQGASFAVRLPVAVQEAKTTRAAEVDSASAISHEEVVTVNAEPDLTGLRVLVVDDEPDTLEVIRAMLYQFGAHVRTAGSSSAALAAFVEWKPDVLVSDLGMPGEDGFTLVKKMQSLARANGGELPAAALTAHVGESDQLNAIAAGYNTHIHKPVDPRTLAVAVATLGKRAKRSGI